MYVCMYVCVWGYLGVRFDIGSLWGLHKMHKTLWFNLMSVISRLGGSVVVFVCWTSPLQDETPGCHDCLVVNGTSKFIANMSSRHGC